MNMVSQNSGSFHERMPVTSAEHGKDEERAAQKRPGRQRKNWEKRSRQKKCMPTTDFGEHTWVVQRVTLADRTAVIDKEKPRKIEKNGENMPCHVGWKR